ncbi:CvpA family protein [Candidatus Profftia sp. (ex Adelges kitamiensis)]|uniref:CvpA family protein n=1 Tax=Candidatus Profftia sp. (ex Adelges kitamiensis) TaxID=2864218 RepID=UPI001CE28506|nr:CvpA family protein [Candidatus Profftia sp. (ex Adelges kitamiensis)]
MFWIDWVIISVILFSAYIGLIRGFINEILSLITWGAACFIASHFYTNLSIYCTSFSEELARKSVAIVILFVITLFIGAIINYIISTLINHTDLKKTDCILGLCFGLMRGLLIVLVSLFFLDTFTAVIQNLDWEESKIVPELINIMKWLFEYIQSKSSFLQENLPSITILPMRIS